ALPISLGIVQIDVEDNGAGVAPQHVSQLFRHGFTTKPNGHGFGLHASANAATQLGGRITAHSDGPGRGARFTLELPGRETVARAA
ncbi:MAG: ATP-binding protein, partial [Planctomycetota bacterium]